MSMPCSDLGLERRYVGSLVSHPHMVLSGAARISAEALAGGGMCELLRDVYELADAGMLSGVDVLARARRRSAGAEREAALVLEQGALAPREVVRAAETLRGYHRARQLREAALRAISALEVGEVETGRVILGEALDASMPEADTRSGTIREAAESWYAEQLRAEQGEATGPELGVRVIDAHLGVLRPGTLHIVGGRSGCRKSSLMLFAALQMASRGHRVGIVSIEDEDSVWGSRALSTFAHHPEMGEYARVLGTELTAADIHLSYPISGTADQIQDAARVLVEDRGCGVLFVDYVQAAMLENYGDRYDKAIASVAKRLKSYGHRKRIPLVLGSQLTTPKGRELKEPHKSDLKESGDLLNIAESVTLLWKETQEPDALVYGRLAKNKWGPDGAAFTLQVDLNRGVMVGAYPGHDRPAAKPAQYGWQG